MSRTIVLVNPPVRLDRAIVQPLGIASVAAQLRAAGYSNVAIIDGCHLVKKRGYRGALRAIRSSIENTRPFIVGCTLHSSMPEETDKVCRSALASGSHVIVGGHGATACHEKTALSLHATARACNPLSITAVVRGEGEETAVQLVGALFRGDSLRGIAGVTYHDGAEVVVNPGRGLLNLNTVGPPAMDLLPHPAEYGGWLNIEESRGCVFQCSFCSIRGMYPTVRLKHPEKIALEVEQARRLGAAKIYLTGELTLLHPSRALAIARTMTNAGMQWSTSAHPSLVIKARSILPALRDNGLACLEVGMEAGSRRSLDVFNKGTTPEMNRRAIGILETAGIPQWLHFIPFHPFMNMRDLRENVMFLSRNLANFIGRPNYPDYLSHEWIPTEGTALFDKACKDGLLLPRRQKMLVRYKDARVGVARQSYQRLFLEKHGIRYYCLHDEMTQTLADAGYDCLADNNRLMLIATLPITALNVAYACALDGAPAEAPFARLVSGFFEAIESDSGASCSDLYAHALEETLEPIEDGAQ